MGDKIKKSVLCDIATRHSDFDFDSFIATTPAEDYDHWNGFCLPDEYSTAAEEYDALRSSCAMFDASPMKKYRFRGRDAGAFLDRILTAPVSQLPEMRAAYGLLCNDEGFLYDDGIVNKIADDDYLLLISEIDLDEHFAKSNSFEHLTISEETPLTAGLALQGPRSCEVLREFGFSGIELLAPFDLKYFELGGHRIMVGRLGFTGDLGYEIWFEPGATGGVADAIAQAEVSLGIKIPGYGLAALQICRLEAGMIVPGWDTAGDFLEARRERTPYELALGWNVKLRRNGDFVGKDALKRHKASGPRFVMKGFVIDEPCLLDEGQGVLMELEDRLVQVGTLPSIAWHTAEKKWIGFASLEVDHASAKRFFIMDGGVQIECKMCTLPFINLERRTRVPAL